MGSIINDTPKEHPSGETRHTIRRIDR